ncbi:MAG: FecR domain-containing protein [Deltaproteobacteria bacterium]|nr:FecR domain-containing protein [Deltaproteobacteria bacterium]
MRWLVAVLILSTAGCSSGKERERRPRERDGAAATRAPTKRTRDAGAPEPRTPLPEAVLASVQGGVEVDRRGRVVVPRRRLGADGGVREAAQPPQGEAQVRAANDMELLIGDAVATGADGTVELRLPEEGSIAVGPDSVIRVSRFGVNEMLLPRGRLHTKLVTPGRGRRVLKVGAPAALVTIAGTQAVVAVADDGSMRVVAITGGAKIRTAGSAEPIELEQGKMIEVDAEGAAGRVVDAPADVDAQTDSWLAGRREVVARDPAKTVRVLAKRLDVDLGKVGPALDELEARRTRNREILKRSSEARAKRDPQVAKMQQELVENSRALVESTDLARSTVLRILLRLESFQSIRARAGEGAALGPGATQIDELTPRIGEIQKRAESQFRRFPKRPRRPRTGPTPGHGLPKLPPIKGQTQIPRPTPEGAAHQSGESE